MNTIDEAVKRLRRNPIRDWSVLLCQETPVIRGTHIPVYDVAAFVAAGLPHERILAAYPGLGEREVRLASIYAEANPARGRPRSVSELPEGARIVTDRRVARRRKTG